MSAATPGPPLPTETATVGTWVFTLLRPDGIDDVMVVISGADGSVQRPG